MNDYIVQLDKDTIVWWDLELVEAYKTQKRIIFEGNQENCQKYLKKLGKLPKVSDIGIPMGVTGFDYTKEVNIQAEVSTLTIIDKQQTTK